MSLKINPNYPCQSIKMKQMTTHSIGEKKNDTISFTD